MLMKQRIKFRLNEILISSVNTIYIPKREQFTKLSITFWLTNTDPHNWTRPDPSKEQSGPDPSPDPWTYLTHVQLLYSIID